jgi:replication factor C subunit 1
MYAISGQIDNYEYYITEPEYALYNIPQNGVKLIVGNKCNDGRPITESWRYKKAISNKSHIIHIKNENGVKKNGETKEPFVTKYAPKTINDLIGHKEQIIIIQNWLKEWQKEWQKGYPSNRGILISGPPGIGKTSCVHIIAKEFGYNITEYNASDTRSVSALRGMIQLGVKRFKKEVIVMDEVDGLSERGGVVELANIIRKTNIPIFCICNEKSPKLKPLLGTGCCLDIKFNRPIKSTIASTIFKIAQKENITISKGDLELLCEQNGNDIRSILNTLEFYRDDGLGQNGAGQNEEGQGGMGQNGVGQKDSILRLDAFSATQKLMSASGKTMSLDDAANLVFVDYSMILMMVSECYLSSSKDSLEDAVHASEFIGCADIIDKRIHRQQTWSLLPNYVQSIIGASRSVSGSAPFQIFPQWLGKTSKRMKHVRWVNDIEQRMNIGNLRLDMSPLQSILLNKLNEAKPDYKGLIFALDELGLTRDDLMEAFADLSLWIDEEKVEIPTKIKSAFTREYNKAHNTKVGKVKVVIEQSEEDLEESEDELYDL